MDTDCQVPIYFIYLFLCVDKSSSEFPLVFLKEYI